MMLTRVVIFIFCIASTTTASSLSRLRADYDLNRDFEKEHQNSGVLQEREHSQICDTTVKQYSGYYKLNTGNKNYFFWFFESRNKPSSDPLILWLTGGPGCSSEVALFGENGPCQVNEDGTDTLRNDFSWNQQANLMYVDQPTGTGFSYGTGFDINEKEVAADMYDFLSQFFKNHEEFVKSDFYVIGESYAGHYVPAISHEIWSRNQVLKDGDLHINLKGISIGNGLTAPFIQYQYYPEMALSNNNHKPAVNKIVYAAMKLSLPLCLAAIKLCNSSIPGTCIAATEICNLGELIPYTLSGMNVYDMREKCEKPPLCYDFSNIGQYLSRQNVREILGVGDRPWLECNKVVALGFALDGDWMHEYQRKLPDLLEDGIRVLIYAGDQDYICNWLGNRAWTRQLVWKHKNDFNAAKVETWKVNNTDVGTIQSSNGFTFLRVYNAGHMVPRDQPKAALLMVNKFISAML